MWLKDNKVNVDTNDWTNQILWKCFLVSAIANNFNIYLFKPVINRLSQVPKGEDKKLNLFINQIFVLLIYYVGWFRSKAK